MCADTGAKLPALLNSLRRQYPAVVNELARDAAGDARASALAAQKADADRSPSGGGTGAPGGVVAAVTAAPSTPASEGPAGRSAVHGSCTFLDAGEPILCEFVRSFLVWECPTPKAHAAIKRIEQGVVDFNELRVCMTDELLRLLGRGVPRSDERAQRLRAALNEVFSREHAVTLERLANLSKREAREYLESLDGVPRFVCARVLLRCFSAHAAPVDSRIHRRLLEAELAETGSSPDEAAGQLEKRVRAGDMPEVYALLQAWADDLASKGDDARPGASRSTGSKGGAARGAHSTAEKPAADKGNSDRAGTDRSTSERSKLPLAAPSPPAGGKPAAVKAAPVKAGSRKPDAAKPHSAKPASSKPAPGKPAPGKPAPAQAKGKPADEPAGPRKKPAK